MVNVKEYIEETYPDEAISILIGLDEAFIGVGSSAHRLFACYDSDKIIDILMERDGMTEEEAEEFFDFNIAGLMIGDNTPVLIDPVIYEEEE